MSGDLEIKAYYAGHVLGAAMFRVKVGDQSVVYTVSELLVSVCVLVEVIAQLWAVFLSGALLQLFLSCSFLGGLENGLNLEE